MSWFSKKFWPAFTKPHRLQKNALIPRELRSVGTKVWHKAITKSKQIGREVLPELATYGAGQYIKNWTGYDVSGWFDRIFAEPGPDIIVEPAPSEPAPAPEPEAPPAPGGPEPPPEIPDVPPVTSVPDVFRQYGDGGGYPANLGGIPVSMLGVLLPTGLTAALGQQTPTARVALAKRAGRMGGRRSARRRKKAAAAAAPRRRRRRKSGGGFKILKKGSAAAKAWGRKMAAARRRK